MTKDIRNYTVGFQVLGVRGGDVTIRPYTIIDGDKVFQNELVLIEGDSYEVSYSKSVEFVDTINVGDRKWTLKITRKERIIKR